MNEDEQMLFAVMIVAVVSSLFLPLFFDCTHKLRSSSSLSFLFFLLFFLLDLVMK
jgi:hypothetical protein